MAKGDLYELRCTNVFGLVTGKTAKLEQGSYLLDLGKIRIAEMWSKDVTYIQMFSVSECVLVWVQEEEISMDMLKVG